MLYYLVRCSEVRECPGLGRKSLQKICPNGSKQFVLDYHAYAGMVSVKLMSQR